MLQGALRAHGEPKYSGLYKITVNLRNYTNRDSVYTFLVDRRFWKILRSQFNSFGGQVAWMASQLASASCRKMAPATQTRNCFYVFSNRKTK